MQYRIINYSHYAVLSISRTYSSCVIEIFKIKGPIHQEDIAIINIYAPNIRAPKYIKQVHAILKQFPAHIVFNEY